MPSISERAVAGDARRRPADLGRLDPGTDDVQARRRRAKRIEVQAFLHFGLRSNRPQAKVEEGFRGMPSEDAAEWVHATPSFSPRSGPASRLLAGRLVRPTPSSSATFRLARCGPLDAAQLMAGSGPAQQARPPRATCRPPHHEAEDSDAKRPGPRHRRWPGRPRVPRRARFDSPSASPVRRRSLRTGRRAHEADRGARVAGSGSAERLSCGEQRLHLDVARLPQVPRRVPLLDYVPLREPRSRYAGPWAAEAVGRRRPAQQQPGTSPVSRHDRAGQ